jgi:hypothetical protein
MARVQDIVEAAASVLTGLRLSFCHVLHEYVSLVPVLLGTTVSFTAFYLPSAILLQLISSEASHV